MHITVDCGVIRLLPSEGVRQLAAHLAEMHRRLGMEYQMLVQQGFEAERSPDGAPWKPLSKATANQRRGRKRRGEHPILRDSGRMSTLALQADDEGAVVGTNVVYAPVHQFGAEVRHAAGAVKLHFRKIKRGKFRGRVRFATSDKADYGMAARAHTVKIPARPWLFGRDGSVPDAWKERMVNIVKTYVEGAYAAAH